MTGRWAPILAAAHEEETRFLTALNQPRQTQVALLKRILAKNQDTEFGRRHRFSDIFGIEDYRRHVPVRTYEDFRSDVARVANGDSKVLTAEPVIAFEETGGSEGGGKHIPYTEDGLRGFRRAVLPWLAGLAKRYPDVTNGSAYVTLSPATRAARTTAGGIPVGLNSDAAYLGDELAPAFASLLAVSPSIGQITDVSAWQIETLTALLEAENLAFVSLWSPTFLLALLASLPDHVDQVLAGASPSARKRLGRAMTTEVLDTHVLWPRLACISCWTDGPSAAFSKQLSGLFPNVALDPKGLLATEAPVTVPLGRDALAVPALTSCVIEFVDESGAAGLSDELADAGKYRIVITTESGLYRYVLGDTVQCLRREGSMAYLRFVGRSGRTSDLVGEKLTETFVSDILASLPVACCLEATRQPPGYILHMNDALHVAMGHITREVERRLCENPQYAHALKMGQLAPLQAATHTSTAQAAIAKGIASGRRMGDVKPLALIPLSGLEE